MTGTADTEAYEFQEIYGLETVVIPQNKPLRRDDQLDRVYKTTREKYEAAIKDIRECYERGQPVLVGTTSIENSEVIDELLNKEGLPHQVLNAKQHAREAEIVAQAGRPKMITIATNMAGRGTDIVLGGNVEKAVEAVEADESLDAAAKQQKIAELRTQWQKDHEFVVGAGRPAHHRHRAPRVAPHRQPAARPLGPPGRPGLVALLPEPGRSADAHLRRRPRQGHHGAAEDARRRGHRSGHRHAQHRERAAQGRSAQLRHPQAVAGIRRRRQRPAQGDLPAAQRHPRRQRPVGPDRVAARGLLHRPGAPVRAAGVGGGAMGHCRAWKRPWPTSGASGCPCSRKSSPPAASPTTTCWKRCSRPPTRRSTPRCSRWAPTTSPSSSGSCCCKASTPNGASTCPRSITCARASTCAATRKSSPSRSTSARRSSCSASCSIR